MNIVAPAGNYEKLEAAIKAETNEVYFGLKGFGARRNNENLIEIGRASCRERV